MAVWHIARPCPRKKRCLTERLNELGETCLGKAETLKVINKCSWRGCIERSRTARVRCHAHRPQQGRANSAPPHRLKHEQQTHQRGINLGFKARDPDRIFAPVGHQETPVILGEIACQPDSGPIEHRSDYCGIVRLLDAYFARSAPTADFFWRGNHQIRFVATRRNSPGGCRW